MLHLRVNSATGHRLQFFRIPSPANPMPVQRQSGSDLAPRTLHCIPPRTVSHRHRRGVDEREEHQDEIEWSERDEARTALVFYGRWAGITTWEECLAVEHRGSDRDTTRASSASTIDSTRQPSILGTDPYFFLPPRTLVILETHPFRPHWGSEIVESWSELRIHGRRGECGYE